MVGIFQGRANLHVAIANIDLRIDGGNLPGEGLILESVNLHRDRLPQLDLIHRLLGHEKIDIDWIERLQRDDHSAGSEILPNVDGADAEVSGKGSAQDLLVDDGLLLRHLRLGILQIGGIGIQLCLADRLRL